MSHAGRITLEGTLEGTSAALESLMAQLRTLAPSPDCDAIELGAAEVLSNIVRHGYGGRPGAIRVAWTAGPKRVDLRFCDCGSPIPADSLEQARHTSLDFGDTRINDLPEGGLGLAFVRRVFHRVRYRSRGRVNRLCVTRKWR